VKGGIILSTSAFASPKNLIWSGIGPLDKIRIMEGDATQPVLVTIFSMY